MQQKDSDQDIGVGESVYLAVFIGVGFGISTVIISPTQLDLALELGILCAAFFAITFATQSILQGWAGLGPLFGGAIAAYTLINSDCGEIFVISMILLGGLLGALVAGALSWLVRQRQKVPVPCPASPRAGKSCK